MIKEFFGLDKANETDEERVVFSIPEEKSTFERMEEEATEWERPQRFADEDVFDDENAASAGADVFQQLGNEIEPQPEKSVSVIAKETTVIGSITTTGHIDIIGDVQGNIAANGNIAVQGNIEGNVAGDRVGLYECKIKGDLQANEGIVAGAESLVVGNVKTKNIVLDGKLKGDIRAENVVVFRSNAYYLGDVTASSIAIETGAVINGNIRTLTDGDPEAPFDV